MYTLCFATYVEASQQNFSTQLLSYVIYCPMYTLNFLTIKTYILSLTHNKDLSSWLSSSLSDRCRDLMIVSL